MDPIRQMLLPDERVRYVARISPIILARGMALLALAAFIAKFFWNIPKTQGLLPSAAKWVDGFPLKLAFIKTHMFLLNHPETVRSVALLLLGFAAINLTKNFLTIFFTQLVVTDQRVILRQGIYEISMVEIDRRKIASVFIHQTYWGRLLNYGHVMIQGFGASIYGLPVLSTPYKVQKYLYAR